MSKAIILDSDDEINIPLDFVMSYTLDNHCIQRGDIVTVRTSAYGLQPGRVDCICDSPFYGQNGVMTAYVVSLEGEPVWTEYIEVSQ